MTEPAPPPDPDALFARWRAGRDPEALGALFDAASPGLFRLALTLAPDAATAEDALQETFLFAMEAPERWDAARPVVPWLAGVLRLKVLEVRRGNRRAPAPERLRRPAPPDDPLLEASGAEERERLHGAMRALPEPYREAAILRWRYGLEPAEIAEARGVPPGTVASWLHRAREKLKEGLGVLPALLPGTGAGLEAVRAELLRQAAAKAAAAAGAGAGAGIAAAAAAGGILVANKAIAAGAVAVLLAGAGWLALRPGAPSPALPPSPPPSVSHSDTPSPPPAPVPAFPEAAAVPALPAPVDLSKCDRDLDLFGVVVDGKDAPVAGAEVGVVTRPWRDVRVLDPSAWAEREPGPSTRSARDGTFALRLPRGSHVDLRVRAEGFVPAVLPWRLAGERVKVVLREGAVVLVLAKDEEGRPVEGAAVTPYVWEELKNVDLRAPATTDAEGKCAFRDLPPGDVLLQVEHPVLGLARVPTTKVPEAGTITVEAVLPGGRTIRGTVTDARTGAPVPGAVVGENWVMLRPVRTGADGRYEKPGCPPRQDTDLYADAAGFARGEAHQVEGDAADFALRPGDFVEGRLVGPDGSPVPDAPVAAVGAVFDRPGHVGADARHGRSGPDGRFRLGGLRHDVNHTLAAEAPGLARLLLEFPPAAEEGGTVDLGDVPMAPGRALEGVVRDGTGAPLPGRAVVLRGPEPGPASRPGRTVDYFFREIQRRSDDLGRFRFHGVAPGRYVLAMANLPGQTPASAAVTVPPDRDVLGAVLEMPAGRDVAVLVVDPAGRPIEGIAVNCSGGEASRSERTDAAGRASFTGLPKREVRVTAWDAGKPRRWVSEEGMGTPVPPEGGEVRIVLREVAWIRGRVLGADGNGIPDLQVHYHPVEEDFGQIAITGKDGSFEAAAPKGRRMTVRITGYGMTAGNRQERLPLRADPVQVDPPSEGVVLRAETIDADRKVTVLLLDLEGKPLEGFHLTILKPGQNSFPTTGADGQATVEGLMAEEIQIGVFPPNTAPGRPVPLPEGAALPAAVKVVPEGQVVTMRLRRGVPLAGTVYDPEGRPAEKAWVSVQTEDGAGASGMTDAAGRFRVWVAPGLKLRHAAAGLVGAGGAPLQKQLQGADLEAPELVFRLEAQPGR